MGEGRVIRTSDLHLEIVKVAAYVVLATLYPHALQETRVGCSHWKATFFQGCTDAHCLLLLGHPGKAFGCWNGEFLPSFHTDIGDNFSF